MVNKKWEIANDAGGVGRCSKSKRELAKKLWNNIKLNVFRMTSQWRKCCEVLVWKVLMLIIWGDKVSSRNRRIKLKQNAKLYLISSLYSKFKFCQRSTALCLYKVNYINTGTLSINYIVFLYKDVNHLRNRCNYKTIRTRKMNYMKAGELYEANYHGDKA